MNNCTGNCNQGRDCDCGPGSGMIIVLGVAVAYGVVIGIALSWIARAVWRLL